MRLAQSANGSDLGNCCETVTQFISQSRAALKQCVATKLVLGTLQEGGALFQTTHGRKSLDPRQAESSTQSAEARHLPLRWGHDAGVFCRKRKESMNGKKIRCWQQFG